MKQLQSTYEYYDLNYNTGVSFHFYLFSNSQHLINSRSSPRDKCYSLFNFFHLGCMQRERKITWHMHIHWGLGAEVEETAGGEKSDSAPLLTACSILLFCRLSILIINKLLCSKPGCFCRKPQPSVLWLCKHQTKRLHETEEIEEYFFLFYWYSQARNQTQVKTGMLNISTFRHALNCKYMSNPNGFSFGDFNSCMVFITTGKTLSNKLPVWLPVVLHHNYWNIFGISQEVQIMKNPPNFLLAQT